MHNPEFASENETNKILWDFEIQTDDQTPARQQDLMIFNKKKDNQLSCGLCLTGRPQ